MKTGSRLIVFGLGVVAVFGLAAVTGAALGPIDVGAPAGHALDHTAGAAQSSELAGLSVASGEYRLVADEVSVTADTPSQYTFRIVTDDGSPVTDFDVLHDRRLHLIVLSRNLIDYLHLHPAMDAGGSWQITIPPLHPGSYRVYADFQPTGADRMTLGTDLQVPGPVGTVPLPAAMSVAETDGYQVTMSGVPVVGSSTIEFDVSRDGEAIATDPYLGAAGHLIVIRTGDLGYLHVHPMDGDYSTVRFDADFPTPGTYRLFFDFAHDDAVHTAAFTITVPARELHGATPGDTTADHEGM
jgi:hypothetical protein